MSFSAKTPRPEPACYSNVGSRALSDWCAGAAFASSRFAMAILDKSVGYCLSEVSAVPACCRTTKDSLARG